MLLEKIGLFNFKNYGEAHVQFSPKINCITGPNGSGKTNLLDAIYYLSLTKSFSNPIDTQNILNNAPFFSIKGTFLKEDKPYEVLCSLKRGEKKVFQVNRSPYEKLREHIGRFPIVAILPDDVDIIKGGSGERRRFFDGIIAQSHSAYLELLLQYKHFLQQRNSLLKRFSEEKRTDTDLLEPYTLKVLQLGKEIHKIRKSFLYDFMGMFKERYAYLSEDRENTSIGYTSDWDREGHEQAFLKNLDRDLALQRTSLGIHRDDFPFSIHDGKALKKYGSQGQQKSYLLALKLAQFDKIKAEREKTPLLLLDDIFDKLDDLRISKLMSIVSGDGFGQLFLTDARSQRVREMLSSLNIDAHFFEVSEGSVREQ